MAIERTFHPLPPWQRTDYCGALRKDDAGRQVALWGWVDGRRDHGRLVFIDLRDREGIIQVVFNPERSAPAHDVARSLRAEYYVAIKGEVVMRAPTTVNAALATGEIEVMAHALEVLNPSAPPPFRITEEEQVTEELRLRYRYLDLRKPLLQRNLRLRHAIMRATRAHFDEHGFVEVETPILWRPTPEGARDYLVPSRVSPGHFYALPQSPQLLKQILMIGGFDRYYQIAKCFRDEDLRANRQPEFSQIDVEMTCPRPEDIIAIIEGLFTRIYRDVLGVALDVPFPRLTYEEAMERFGSDKPDARFGMELRNLTAAFAETELNVIRRSLAERGAVYGLRLPSEFQLTRRELDEMVAQIRSRFDLGLSWAKVATEDEWQGPIAKHLGQTEKSRAARVLELAPGDTVFLMAGARNKVRPAMGDVRLQLGARFVSLPPGLLRFMWVVNFPLFERSEQEGRLTSVNHPFTAPCPEDLEALERDPLSVHALAYDVVLNGEELGGGSIRIHNSELQLKVFELLGLSRDEAMDKFGFLIEALSYGAPPHGGIALGLDRIAMLICGTDSLRDVMAFPKTQRAVDLMSGAPAEVDPAQLEELCVKILS
jgi:aspartyl-tRNA synthetase